MEKLLNLLNEYSKYNWEKIERGIFMPEVGQEGVLPTHNRLTFCKEYGFIKWLVDNHKVYLDRIPIIQGDSNIYSLEENLLMWLAIQDDPINYLVSILY